MAIATEVMELHGGEAVDEAWLTKPFYMPELRAHMHRLLQRTTRSEIAAEPIPEVDRSFATRLEAHTRAHLSDESPGLPETLRVPWA